MTTGLQYSEDYSDPKAEVWSYSAAGSPLPGPAITRGRGPIGNISKPSANRVNTERPSPIRQSIPIR
jgi:hypothetical protein